MSEADKIFKRLGYDIEENDNEYIKYYNKEDLVYITFDKYIQHVTKHQNNIDMVSSAIYIPELKAINKKCEELGWL